jgi:hypothetical protein
MELAQPPLLGLDNSSGEAVTEAHKSRERTADIRLALDAGHVFDAIHSIFPTQQEENRIQKARRVMGDDIKDLTDEDLDVYLTEFNFLLDSWLDDYERSVFDNKTLQQLLREG